MSIVVTGFGPFPGVPRNRTQVIVERLRRRIAGRDIHGVVLPTVYEEAGRAIENLLSRHRPDICLCLGVAGSGPVRLETTARNQCTARTPDQSGASRRGAIVDAGPPAYSSTLPLEALRSGIGERGVEVEFSDDAGGYVCNHVFYIARHAIEQAGLSTRCGFIHIPTARAGDDEDREFARLEEAVNWVIEHLATASKDMPSA